MIKLKFSQMRIGLYVGCSWKAGDLLVYIWMLQTAGSRASATNSTIFLTSWSAVTTATDPYIKVHINLMSVNFLLHNSTANAVEIYAEV